MPNLLEIFVPGDPVAKGRPRVTSIAGPARTYTPAKTRNYEQLVALAASQSFTPPQLDGPIEIWVRAVVRRPKSRPKKYRHPDKRPDLDNYVKSVLDGIQQAGVWRDDAQVCRIVATKEYPRDDSDRPGVHVTIQTMRVVLENRSSWAARPLRGE